MYKWTNNDLRQSFVKTLKLNITLNVQMIRVNDTFVCSPTDYGKMSTFVGLECGDANNRWIYQIIDKQWDALDEQVCLDKEDWVMVKNKQHNQDLRFLVIFKDKGLKTIRELRREHVSLLQDIQTDVTAYMQEHGYENFMMYFHYLPSVFQLHLHVNAQNTVFNSKPNDRIQPLQSVVRNLQHNSEHYAHALILTKHCKIRHRAEILEKRRTAI